jgi:hypothetical protein
MVIYITCPRRLIGMKKCFVLLSLFAFVNLIPINSVLAEEADMNELEQCLSIGVGAFAEESGGPGKWLKGLLRFCGFINDVPAKPPTLPGPPVQTSRRPTFSSTVKIDGDDILIQNPPGPNGGYNAQHPKWNKYSIQDLSGEIEN